MTFSHRGFLLIKKQKQISKMLFLEEAPFFKWCELWMHRIVKLPDIQKEYNIGYPEQCLLKKKKNCRKKIVILQQYMYKIL